MKSIKGPAIFLAQFAGSEAPFNTFDSICGWAANLGYEGVQIPAWDDRFIDLKKAAQTVSATARSSSELQRRMALRSLSLRRTCKASSWR